MPSAWYIVTKIINLFAMLVKTLGKLHFALFPRARFTIPAHARPLFRSRKAYRIPRIVWLTNYSDKVTLAVYCQYLFNRLMAPTFEVRYHSDDAARAYIQANFPPQVFAAYSRLNIGAAKADYWRVLVLLRDGGVYLDMDANFVRPLEWIIGPDDTSYFITARDGLITNYFLAAAPDNPLYVEIERAIRTNIDTNSSTDVFELTGPAAMRPVLEGRAFPLGTHRTVCYQGQFTNAKLQYPEKSVRKWTEEQKDTSVLD